MLVLAMLLSVAYLQVFAEDKPHTAIEGSATTVDVGGETYKVVRTVADLPKTEETDGRYILACDIDFGGANPGDSTIDLGNGAILDGNGYSLLNFELLNDSTDKGKDGMFKNHSNSVFTVRNLTFGTAEAPIKVANGLAGRNSDRDTTKSVWENVTAHVIQTRNGGNVGAFYGTIKGDHTFKNCNVYTYSTNLSERGSNFGGYIGGTSNDNAKATFENCNSYGDIHRTNNAAGFIGYVQNENVVLNFKNCNNYANIHIESGNGAGGFVSVINKASTTATFENCNNYGVLGIELTIDVNSVTGNNIPSIKTRASVAGFVAENTGVGVYKNCRNNASLYNKNETGANAAGIEGLATKATLENCFNAGNMLVATNAGGNVGGLVGQGDYITVKDSVSIGDLTINGIASEDPENPFIYNCGNIAGRSNNWSVKACIGVGALSGTNATKGVLFGGSGTCTDIVGDGLSDEQLTAEYEAFENKYLYVDDYNLNGAAPANRLTPEGAIEALNALSTAEKFILGDNGTPVVATPAFNAVQVGAKDASVIRLIGTVDTLVFNKVGFEYTVTYAGESAPAVSKTVYTSKVLAAIDGTENEEKLSTSADKLGGLYIYAYTVSGLRTDAVATVTVKPLSVSGATVYEGATVSFTYSNGTVTVD